MQRNEIMILDQFPIGPMQNFCYFIGDADSRQVAVVDPAWDADAILARARDHGYTLTAVLLTHGHYDHCNAVRDLLAQVPVPVYLSRNEAGFYQPDCETVQETTDGQEILIGRLAVRCIHTPGHTPGGQCFLAGNILLTGDTLFVNGCGRCDLPGGNARTMYHTLYEVLLKLPDETEIYPGHAYGGKNHATLGEQKKTNPYLSCRDQQEFLKERMGE